MLEPSLGLKSLGFVLKVNCTSYIHLQDCSGTRSISELGADQEFGVNAQGLTLNMVGFSETLTSVSQIVNVGADLEGRT